MSGWTRRPSSAFADNSPEDSPMQWRMARDALGSPELGVSRFTYEPDARMPFGHRHRSFEAGPDGFDLVFIGGRKPNGGRHRTSPDFWD